MLGYDPNCMMGPRRVIQKVGRILRRLVLGLLACGPASAQSPPGEQIQAVDKAIHVGRLAGHLRFLADDLLEGRGPGSQGDLLARRYIASQLESHGMRPLGSSGWEQPVPLRGIATKPPKEVLFRTPGDSLTLKHRDDLMLVCGVPEEAIDVAPAELVFVGYGIQAPEYQWDDYKGKDLRGKILVMLNNDPADDPALFEGKKRLYYGRWDYKYEMAAKMGAAGALIVHTTESAGYPYSVVQNSWSGEEFELRDDRSPRTPFKGWITEEAIGRVSKLAGKAWTELLAAAQKSDFQPVALGVTCGFRLESVARTQDSANVLGWLQGSDPKLRDQCVIVMAHHDHLGKAEARNADGDDIYNGAIDNASGVASMLCLAAAMEALPKPPRRSILFASVAAEEQGLLGSKYFAQNPPIAPGRMAGLVNIDGIGFLGKTRDVNVIGQGKSSLDQVIESIAKWQGRVVVPDLHPDRGYYYRSDQFSLAKLGVPAIYLHAGQEVEGKPEGWGREQIEQWVEKHYHQPSDEFRADWDLSGAVQDAKLLFLATMAIAEADNIPTWKPGDEFEAARKQAIEALPP